MTDSPKDLSLPLQAAQARGLVQLSSKKRKWSGKIGIEQTGLGEIKDLCGHTPNKSLVLPIAFDKELRDSKRRFQGVRKRYRCGYNNVTCVPEHSLSSERDCSDASKMIYKLALKGKFKKVKVLKNLKLAPKEEVSKEKVRHTASNKIEPHSGGDKKRTIRLDKRIRECRNKIKLKQRDSVGLDSSSTESHSIRNEFSQEEEKLAPKLIRPVKSVDLSARKSCKSKKFKPRVQISSTNSLTPIPQQLETPCKPSIKKPPLPKKCQKRYMISKILLSKSSSFNSSPGKGRVSPTTLCLTPKTKHRLSLSPHRRVIRRRRAISSKDVFKSL
ncbi:unnamed protein product [Moneuplotes crassus]|uniref:Uncharacterized protein n=1 Tax=Euplotes crassus TaxID=5936 RepID=A0AAD1UM49_EUPCR|nr:unnamed protein product [Moneuplotes crassus]